MRNGEHDREESTGLERIAGLAVAAVLVLGGAALAWRFGPWPEAHADAEHAAAPVAPAAVRPDAGASGLFETLGGAAGRTASGESELGVDALMDAVERTYLDRGFARGDLDAGASQRSANAGTAPRSSHGAFYFRSECPIAMVAAIGRNADPAATADRSGAEPAAYVTIASPSAAGGSSWATYRFDADASRALAKIRLVDGNGDFPGADPMGLPRIPGSRRLLVVPRLSSSGVIAMYEVRASIDAVRAFYADEMARRYWQLEAYESLEMAPLGAQIYSLGDLMCTVWIQQNRSDAERIGIVIVSP